MDVVCQGPFHVRSLIWQPRFGAWAQTISCTALFELGPRESPLVRLPLDPVEAEGDERALVEPWGPVAPVKQRPEVIVIGDAYAPAGTSVKSLVARLAVGEIDKVVCVYGDSYFTQEGALHGPLPFERMPLRWERAAGGPGTLNPVGVRTGPELLADTRGRSPLPNLRPMGASLTSRDHQVIQPASFGPIAPTWPSRVQRLLRQTAGWNAARWAEQPLPDGFDFSYFNVAPPDQMLEEINGTERIVLEHLHPRSARLVTYLKSVTPQAVARVRGADQAVPLTCDTLVIDADRGFAALVWRGRVTLDHPRAEGLVLVSSEALAAPTETVQLTSPQKLAAALPFAPGSAAMPLPAAPRKPKPPPVQLDPVVQTVTVPAFQPPAPLPFQSAPEDASDEEPATLRPAALEPIAPASEVPPPIAPPPMPPPLVAPPLVASLPMAPEPPPPAPVAPLMLLPTFAPSPSPSHELEPAPSLSAPSPSPVAPPAPPRPKSEPPPPPPPPEPEPEKPRQLSLEETAAIAARIAHRPDDATKILEAEKLTSESWTEQHQKRLAEIEAELARGKKKLLADYDVAYVVALEDARGQITPKEYASLQVAIELNRGPEKLAEMDLPEEALMRIRRVWLTKLVKDPRAAAEVRAAIKAETQ